MARIIPLCSSSKGNSVYIGNKKSGVLIDIGCSFKMLNELLAQNDIPIDSVKALLITHEHIDHVKGLFQFTKHTGIPIYTSNATLDSLVKSEKVYSVANLYNLSNLKNAPCDYSITAFRTPHDAVESVGYILRDVNDCKIAYCTDLGNVTTEVYDSVINSEIVFIESNYEPDLLKNNAIYPDYLKKRIQSDYGHLSNQMSAEFIRALVLSGARRIILGHLSVENNRPELAYNNVVEMLNSEGLELDYDYTLNVAPVVYEGVSVTI